VNVTTEEVDGAIVAIIDDGKVNALSVEIIGGIRAAVAEAAGRRRPLVLAGRDGCLSAGFDLTVVNGGDADLVKALFSEGADLYGDIVGAPVPVVVACTGHALAGGALLLLSADYRVGRHGNYQIGLNEARIGMALPNFAVVLASHRLERRYLTAATMFAELVPPGRAVEMGYLDECVDDPLGRAVACAAELAQLPADSFAATKRRIRRDLVRALADLKGPRSAGSTGR
jgi:enoyl-CoA hydratase